MNLRNHLHALTCLLLPLTVAAAIWTNSAAGGFSDAMKRRAQLGLPGRFVHVPIAVELAGSSENIWAIFGGTEEGAIPASADDRKYVNESLSRDYLLIVAYTSLMIVLGLRTWQPGFPGGAGRRWWLLILPLLVAICDYSENRGAQAALSHYPAVSAGIAGATKMVSMAKWMLGFIQMVVLGCSMLGLSREPCAGAFLRELAGLILCSAGAIGLFGIVFPSIIPNTFLFGLLALVPIGLMLFIRDSWWKSPMPDRPA